MRRLSLRDGEVVSTVLTLFEQCLEVRRARSVSGLSLTAIETRTRGGPETNVALCVTLVLSTGAVRLMTPRRIADMLDVSWTTGSKVVFLDSNGGRSHVIAGSDWLSKLKLWKLLFYAFETIR